MKTLNNIKSIGHSRFVMMLVLATMTLSGALGMMFLTGTATAGTPCVDITYSNVSPYNTKAHECVGKLQTNLNSWRSLVPVPIGQGQPGKKLTVDSIFGSATEAQVKVFQQNNGVAVDGIVGPKTWNQVCQEASSLGYSNDGIGC